MEVKIPFEDQLEQLVEHAELVAREGRDGAFRDDLEILEELVLDTLRYRAQLATVSATSIVEALLGWGPEGQIRSQIRGLGSTVLGVDSVEVINAWLYFPQKTLRKSRYLEVERGDLGFLLLPWYQAAIGLERLPAGVDPWIRWREYVRELNMFIDTATVKAVLTRCFEEVVQFLKFARTLVARVPASFFDGVAGLVDEAGGTNQPFVRRRPVDSDQYDYKQKARGQLLDLKRMFWLGWLGQTLRRRDDGRLTDDQVLAQWARINGAFPDFASVIAAWKAIGANDIFDWEGEESSRRLQQAQATGVEAGAVTVDQYAGTTRCLALLGLRMGVLRGDPDLIGELGFFPHFVRPELDRIAAEGFDRWGRIVGAANDEQFANRLTDFRAQLTEAAHLREGQDQRRLAESPIDPAKVAALIDRLGAGLDTQGIRLLERLRRLGLVQWSDVQFEGETAIRWAMPYPKEGLIARKEELVVVGAEIPLYEVEDRWLLEHIFRGNRRIRTAKGLDMAGTVLDRTIESLADGQMSASLIVVPWDWELTAHLLRRDGQDPLLAPDGNTIGTYRGIELIRGLRWLSRDLIFVLSLPHVSRITIHRPAPPILRDRFHVEVRPPTDRELESELQKPAPKSSVGLPFAGPDLIAYRRNEWRIEVIEQLRFDERNQAAARAIRVVRDAT